MKRLPRLAWFSNLSPNSTSGYWSRLMLPRLMKRFECDVFTAEIEPTLDLPQYHYLSAGARDRAKRYDFYFYQLEDQKSSHFSRIHLALVPGAVLFHDFLLSDDGPEPILNSPWQVVVDRFRDRSVSWPPAGTKFERTCKAALRECAFAAPALFSSVRDHEEFKRLARKRAFDVQSHYVPHPVEPAVEEVRERGLVAFCGSARIEHRAHKVLQALSALNGRARLVWLLDAAEEAEARALSGQFSARCEFVVGRTPERWASICGRANVALHLLFSAFGQSGPYLPISLRRGTPSVISDFGGSWHLPDSVVFKVMPGESEAAELRAVIDRLIDEHVLSLPQARDFAANENDADCVAEELGDLLIREIPAMAGIRARWEEFGKRAGADLLKELRCGKAADGALEAWGARFGAVVSELGWRVEDEP